jgi:hypothetical protein
MQSLNKFNKSYEPCECSNETSNKGCPVLNIGHSARLSYDCCAYDDKLTESTGPIGYRLNDIQMHNCSQCLSTLGPRSSLMGQGVSTTIGHPVATAQKVVDVESILSNRNMKTSKCRRDQVNTIDVTKFDNKNLGICDDFLNPLSSRLTYPAQTYRDIAVNRFHNLNQNPQLNIFYDFAINTTLEAKDNHLPRIIQPLKNSDMLPKPI